MRVPSGKTDKYIYFVAVDSTDFTTRETGLSSFTVYRSRNGAAAVAMTTPTINEVDATNLPGVYELLVDEDTTITTGSESEEMVLHITHAGMAPVTRTVEIYEAKSFATVEQMRIEMDSNSTQLAAIVGDTNELQTDLTNGGRIDLILDNIASDTNELQTDWANGGRLDTILDATSTASALTSAASDITAIKAVTDNHPDSGNFTTIDSNIDAILVDTSSTLSDHLTDIKGATFSASTDSLEAIRNRGDSAWITGGGGAAPTVEQIRAEIDSNSSQLASIVGDTQNLQSRIPSALSDGRMVVDVESIGGSTVSADKLKAVADIATTGTAQTGTLSTTQMTTNINEATADHFIGRIITWKSGPLSGQQSEITDYELSGGLGLFTFTTVTDAPQNGNEFVIT